MEAISEGILFFGVLAGMVCLCVFLGSKLVALEAEFEQDAKKKRPAEKVAWEEVDAVFRKPVVFGEKYDKVECKAKVEGG